MCLQIIYLIYMYEEDMALNNLQWFICHKTKPNQTNKRNSGKHHNTVKIDITLKVFDNHHYIDFFNSSPNFLEARIFESAL